MFLCGSSHNLMDFKTASQNRSLEGRGEGMRGGSFRGINLNQITTLRKLGDKPASICGKVGAVIGNNFRLQLCITRARQ